MFENANVGGDTMAEILAQLFRLPPDGKPMTIMQLAGFPAEVVDSVVSVLCRMAFDFGLWSDGALPLLFVCEEAHRYAPADRKIGFGPTRRAISRIAKEGRKYGVFLGLVTQRPAELDPTIISQCSRCSSMRMSNDRDQALIRSAVSDAAANLLGFMPSLGTREVFAFGAGVAVPTRLRFNELPADDAPEQRSAGNTRSEAAANVQQDLIRTVIERWRSATMNHKAAQDMDFAETAPRRLRPCRRPRRRPWRHRFRRAHSRWRRHRCPVSVRACCASRSMRAAALRPDRRLAGFGRGRSRLTSGRTTRGIATGRQSRQPPSLSAAASAPPCARIRKPSLLRHAGAIRDIRDTREGDMTRWATPAILLLISAFAAVAIHRLRFGPGRRRRLDHAVRRQEPRSLGQDRHANWRDRRRRHRGRQEGPERTGSW